MKDYEKIKEFVNEKDNAITVNDFKDAPKAYAIDFGVIDDGKTLVVEVNASCCIGSYGLDVIKYAKFRSARWAELTNTEDECAFDL